MKDSNSFCQSYTKWLWSLYCLLQVRSLLKFLHFGFSLLLVETNTQESQMVNIVKYSFMSGRIGDHDKELLFILP